MDSNVTAHVKQSDVAILFFTVLSGLIVTVLFVLFEDEKAEDEERKQRALAFKQTVFQAFFWVLDVVAGNVAGALNVLLQYVTHFLQAIGIQVGLPVNPVTPEGVIIVAQWVFLLLICYGVITLAFLLVTFFLRCLWWLLKVGVALACFGLILNDHSVDTKTMVFRLLSLGCICLLLSTRPCKAAKIVHLDEQVKILEKRV
ncbi:uncharacterized protein LOC119487596 [Sebastes umbrosus]|uniref:uncharacterized protein LOC119487596 n=1 Tax=Sebastes umbrosus TaxID=72105 RepID=UPI0018A0DB2B|nr:uncharacterized protein LOC119487596 [Sebastes umbrosus]